MLFDPFCFIEFIQNTGEEVVEYVDNWAEGVPPIFHLFNDLPIDMAECIHIDIAKKYLLRLNLQHLIALLTELDCPCNNSDEM